MHKQSASEIELGDSLLKANPKIRDESLPTLFATMRALAVIPIATCVLRNELLQLRQERDQPFRAFAAKVRGKAETCNFSDKCTGGDSVEYADHIIRDVIMNCSYDTDIRREVLGLADTLEKPVNEVIVLVETKEMARNALPTSDLSDVVLPAAEENTINHHPLPGRSCKDSELSGLPKSVQDIYRRVPWLE